MNSKLLNDMETETKIRNDSRMYVRHEFKLRKISEKTTSYPNVKVYWYTVNFLKNQNITKLYNFFLVTIYKIFLKSVVYNYILFCIIELKKIIYIIYIYNIT